MFHRFFYGRALATFNAQEMGEVGYFFYICSYRCLFFSAPRLQGRVLSYYRAKLK